eukprot:GSChrysophyteH1.ASY1.ANO1.2976.1 assembled CDS
MDSLTDNATVVGAVVGLAVVGVSYIFLKPSSGEASSSADQDEANRRARSGSVDASDKYPGGKLQIFFGSQTGTSEGFARVVMEEGKERGFDAEMCDLEDFEPDDMMKPKLALFLMATYGEGEPTDNANKFYHWLKPEDKQGSTEAAQPGDLSDLKFGVFGLGNRQYEHYNHMGKATNKYLEQFGGQRVVDYGEGDDDGDLEADFDAWREVMWTQMKVSLQYNIKNLRDTSSKTAKKLGNALEIGSTRHIEIDLRGSGLTYETADNLAIMPENSSSSVERLARAQGYDLDQMFTIECAPDVDEKKFKFPFPVPCSVRTALTSYADMHGSPKQSCVQQLLPYVTDDRQKKCNCKSVFSLLTAELSSAEIPLEDLLHILPSIQPRYYTISSSSSVHPQCVHITVSITEFALPSGEIFQGLTSGYTRDMKAPEKVRAFVRPSSFRLPKKLSTPIIMIGPGTGIAPMRALLQERRHQHGKKNGAPAKNTLYFGCKYSDVDYIYEDELTGYSAEELTLYTAFSREIKGKKVYVQNLMQNSSNSAEFMRDLDDGAYIYVCGATAMGADVHNALIAMLKASKGFSQTKATGFLADLQKSGRYVQELWSA